MNTFTIEMDALERDEHEWGNLQNDVDKLQRRDWDMFDWDM